ncbi:hypothetical protein MTR_7g076540 [Medicago truncatula]|uniref:Uncharacterized protein n=1 Tax=Medicago truncatula TaxID=3880 RepID=G7L2J5_MEDTR|nr:hypothetical protein MTR_7g076540 [Medicago truncatula]
MEENFNSAFTLPSNSKEDPQMNDQTKMANAYRSFAGEGYRSVATEVFSTPDQIKMDLKNQSGKSTLAIKTGPKMHLLLLSSVAKLLKQKVNLPPLDNKVCGEQGHNRRSCFKFLSFKESISRH